jgi:hypothetical protein
MPVRHTPCIKQIRRQRAVRAFHRIALYIGIAEQPFFIGFIVSVRQADDDDMDMRLAPRLAAPRKRAVREEDFEVEAVEQYRP